MSITGLLRINLFFFLSVCFVLIHNVGYSQCTAELTSISVTGPLQVCKDLVPDKVNLSNNGTTAADYTYIITDALDIIIAVVSGNEIDFNEYAANEYRIYGVSHSGNLTANLGSNLTSISASICLIRSDNFASVLVLEVKAEASTVSDYNGYPISKAGAQDGSIIAYITGGSGAYEYEWNTIPIQQNSFVSALPAGMYIVSITDTLYGCMDMDSVELFEPDSLKTISNIVSNYMGFDVSCAGTEDGQVTVSPTGGVAPYTYEWSNNPALNSNIATSLSAGLHTITVTDANGAERISSITLSSPPPLNLIVDSTKNSCAGSPTGAIYVHAEGGVDPYNYRWSTFSPAAFIVAQPPGTYSCVVWDQNECKDTVTVDLLDNSNLDVTLFPTDVDCPGGTTGSILLSVSGGAAPFSYAWSNGLTTQNAFDIAAGAYTVKVTDRNGCNKEYNASISEPSPMDIQFMTTPDNGTGNGTAAAIVEGGNAPYLYEWSTGQTGAEIDGLPVGEYVLRITDSLGCMAEASFQIEPNGKLSCLKTHMGFSPNGDGINDNWEIPCIPFFPENELTILNRWGQELLYVVNYDNSWNGTINGRPLPDGTYYYLIKLQEDTSRRIYKGTISIVR